MGKIIYQDALLKLLGAIFFITNVELLLKTSIIDHLTLFLSAYSIKLKEKAYMYDRINANFVPSSNLIEIRYY